ncbi:MBL fold metallo-hydrolase [Tistrella mobilis]
MWTTTEIAPGAWFVQRDWLSCNHFIARDPHLTLIDTGFDGDLDETVSILKQMGAEPRDVELIVNTHCHCDHAGGNRFFTDASGCDVWMHAAEKARIDARDDIGTWWRFHDTWAAFFDVNRGLEEGDEFRFGPLTLQVLHAPGHSRGLMVLYAPEIKALFSADAVWQGDMGVINPIVEGEDALERAVETLRRLDALNVATVYPGHGPVVTNPRPVIARLLRKLDRYATTPLMMHTDHLRKMLAYIVMTKGGMREAGFFEYLMGTVWYPQLVDRYFGGDYAGVYDETIQGVLRTRMMVRRGDSFYGVGSDK